MNNKKRQMKMKTKTRIIKYFYQNMEIYENGKLKEIKPVKSVLYEIRDHILGTFHGTCEHQLYKVLKNNLRATQ